MSHKSLGIISVQSATCKKMGHHDGSYISAEGGTTTDTEGGTDWEDANEGEEKFEDYAIPKEAVIVFLDVDSFDVQVRGRNEGINPEVLKREPYVVVNNHNVITAVNYSAKKHGIRRAKGCTLAIAKGLCPQLRTLVIPDHYGKPDALGLRKASDEIYDSLERSLQKWCGGRPLPKIEKSSKDEFYVDISDEVFHRVHRQMMAVPSHKEVHALKQRKCHLEAPGYSASNDKLSFRTLQVLTNKNIIQDRHVTEALLMHGAVIANWLLKDIQRETGFTLSAGVSSNKLLAKLGCSYHKPDAITVLPHSSLGRVSKNINIEDIPGLGGKLGAQIAQKLRIETMSQLGHKDRVVLMKVMGGEQSLKFHQMAVGYDPTKVVAKKFCNSLKCGITFNYRTRRMHKPQDFQEHLMNRFLEMREHLTYDCSRNGLTRVPKSMRLEVRTKKHDLKVAFGASEAVDLNLQSCIGEEANAYPELFIHGELPEEWENFHDMFVERINKECKIDVLNYDNFKAACAAVRKVSEINLIANFSHMDGDED